MSIDLVQHIKDTRLRFSLATAQWESFPDVIRNRIKDSRKWKTFKFMHGEVPNEVALSKVPRDKGGIYTFHIEPNVIPKGHKYLIYIGEVFFSDTRNLQVRIKEYRNDKRPKLVHVFDRWKKYIYCRYLPLDLTDAEIEAVEDALIDGLIPLCNTRFKSEKVREAVSAFGMT